MRLLLGLGSLRADSGQWQVNGQMRARGRVSESLEGHMVTYNKVTNGHDMPNVDVGVQTVFGNIADQEGGDSGANARLLQGPQIHLEVLLARRFLSLSHNMPHFRTSTNMLATSSPNPLLAHRNAASWN